MQKTKLLSLILALVMLFGLFVPAYANPEDINANNGTGTSIVTLTAAATQFKVTVPTGLPIHMAADGAITCAESGIAKITNSSYGPVEVKEVTVDTSSSDWSLVAFTADFTRLQVGLKNFAFQLMRSNVDPTNGSCSVENFLVINGNSNITLNYDGKVAPQSTEINDWTVIANVIFTIRWSTTSNSNPSTPTMITFSVNGTSYTIEENTTVENWISSLSSTSGFSSVAKSGSSVDVLTLDDEEVFQEGASGDDVNVYLSGIIQSGAVYYTSGNKPTTPNTPSTVTFSIGTESYTAEEGMTIREWLNSTSYDSGSYALNAAEELVDNSGNNVVYGSVNVIATRVIANGDTYTIKSQTVTLTQPTIDDSLPTFVMDGITYNYETNMTFTQWVSSEYNVNGYKLEGYLIYSPNNIQEVYISKYNGSVYGLYGTTKINGNTYTYREKSDEPFTFTVNSVQYQANELDQPNKWVNKAYNTDGFKIVDGNFTDKDGNQILDSYGSVIGQWSNLSSTSYYTGISFTMDGTTYTAFKDETFEQYRSRGKLNNAGYYTKNEQDSETGEWVWYVSGKNNTGYLTYNGNPVFRDNAIVENGVYTSADSLTEPATPTTINFTVGGTAYTALSGMTWSQWVANTTYNTDGYVLNDDMIMTSDAKVVTQSTSSSSQVYKNYEISDNGEYGLLEAKTSTYNFEIDGTTYTGTVYNYYIGENLISTDCMTAQQWVSSAYNTDNYTISNGVLVNGNGMKVKTGGNYTTTVASNDVIYSETVYTVEVSFTVDGQTYYADKSTKVYNWINNSSFDSGSYKINNHYYLVNENGVYLEDSSTNYKIDSDYSIQGGEVFAVTNILTFTVNSANYSVPKYWIFSDWLNSSYNTDGLKTLTYYTQNATYIDRDADGVRSLTVQKGISPSSSRVTETYLTYANNTPIILTENISSTFRNSGIIENETVDSGNEIIFTADGQSYTTKENWTILGWINSNYNAGSFFAGATADHMICLFDSNDNAYASDGEITFYEKTKISAGAEFNKLIKFSIDGKEYWSEEGKTVEYWVSKRAVFNFNNRYSIITGLSNPRTEENGRLITASSKYVKNSSGDYIYNTDIISDGDAYTIES